MNTTLKKILPFLIINIVIGVIVIFLVLKSNGNSSINTNITRDSSKNFVFTSPILDCENLNQGDSTVLSYKETKDLAQKISDKYNISDYSIYFRDLNNGPWVGINEKEVFSPASLMKTPLLIAFLKQVERNPELLKKEVIATDEYFDYSIKQNYDLQTKVIKGQTYTLEEVAILMISDSDNVAALMLSKYISQKDFDNLLISVGVPIEKDGKDVDIRVKDFAGFFRVLYNASYLDRDMSELALSILSKSTFSSGLVSGLPKGITVAHKYGERSLEQKQGGVTLVKERQLHDCGIIYIKPTPYILCIMTRGQDFAKQEEFISSVSKYIYEKVSKKVSF